MNIYKTHIGYSLRPEEALSFSQLEIQSLAMSLNEIYCDTDQSKAIEEEELMLIHKQEYKYANCIAFQFSENFRKKTYVKLIRIIGWQVKTIRFLLCCGEPSVIALFLAGLLGFSFMRKRLR